VKRRRFRKGVIEKEGDKEKKEGGGEGGGGGEGEGGKGRIWIRGVRGGGKRE